MIIMIVIWLHNTCHCTYSLAIRTSLLVAAILISGAREGARKVQWYVSTSISFTPSRFASGPILFSEVATLYEGWTGGYQGWSGGGKMLWSPLSHVRLLWPSEIRWLMQAQLQSWQFGTTSNTEDWKSIGPSILICQKILSRNCNWCSFSFVTKI